MRFVRLASVLSFVEVARNTVARLYAELAAESATTSPQRTALTSHSSKWFKAVILEAESVQAASLTIIGPVEIEHGKKEKM